MYRFDLTDDQWGRIEPFFPDRYHHGKAGHPWTDHRPLVNGVLWHLHTGAPWPDTPGRYGPWQTVYDRFKRWRRDGPWANILDTLLLRLDDKGFIQRDLWCVDATGTRAGAAAAGAEKKLGWQTRLEELNLQISEIPVLVTAAAALPPTRLLALLQLGPPPP